MSSSESEKDSSATESPFIKTRPILQQQKSSVEYESDDAEGSEHVESGIEDEESEEEDEEGEPQEEEESDESNEEQQHKAELQAKVRVVGPKPSSRTAIKPTMVKSVVPHQHPSYDKMVYEAVKELDENKRSGTSISKIIKFVTTKYDLKDSKVKLFCKKAFEKGIKDETYVKTSGVGMTGSINFSTKHKQKLNKEKKKETVPPKKPTTKAKTAVKPKSGKSKTDKKQPSATKEVTSTKTKAKPKAKSTKSSKDANNNSAATTGAKKPKAVSNTKTKVSKATGKVRLSINPNIAPKLKPQPKNAAAKASVSNAKGVKPNAKLPTSKTKAGPATAVPAKKTKK
ncbi:histone H1-like [Topomyia yanbarensis]|uniref:histone H1-like n=1 Tax=Topomyia yanbarensis TaxID=2498891 RepID=UPI00273AB036|nr:histone H1-like [Topomyia yanbarensis]XP_058818994.1 histone H1-like [Topomyia yanbarensis]